MAAQNGKQEHKIRNHNTITSSRQNIPVKTLFCPVPWQEVTSLLLSTTHIFALQPNEAFKQLNINNLYTLVISQDKQQSQFLQRPRNQIEANHLPKDFTCKNHLQWKPNSINK